MFFNRETTTVTNINNEQQRELILKICYEILFSILYKQNECNDECNDGDLLLFESYEYSAHNNVDKLLQEVFQSKNINVKYINNLGIKSFFVSYDRDILDSVIPIVEDWFKPCVKQFQDKHNEKLKEWNLNYDKEHTEDKWKNDLIIKKLPESGFKYLIDFQWDSGSEGVGDLIFGSDCGIYLVLETKWLNMSPGQQAQNSRIFAKDEVKERARKFKGIARKKFNNNRVIGASFRNDDKYVFVDSYDENIFDAIGRRTQTQKKKSETFSLGQISGSVIGAAGAGTIATIAINMMRK